MKRVSDKLHKINVKGTQTRDLWEKWELPRGGAGRWRQIRRRLQTPDPAGKIEEYQHNKKPKIYVIIQKYPETETSDSARTKSKRTNIHTTPVYIRLLPRRAWHEEIS